jgi:hypothetical protein
VIHKTSELSKLINDLKAIDLKLYYKKIADIEKTLKKHLSPKEEKPKKPKSSKK